MLWLLFSPASPVNKAPETSPPAAREHAPEATPAAKEAPRPRVASTSPAITDSLVALGLAEHVVGRSPFCRSVPEAVPVVGDLRDFDAERLALVAPDVLFVQPPLAGVDPALRDFCAVKRIPLVDRRLDSLAELDGLVDDIASAFRVAPDASGEGLAKRLADAKAALAPAAASAAGAPRTLLLVSAEPFLAVGRGSYLDELLSRSGAANALERDGYVELGAEALVALAPARVLIVAETDRGAARALELLRALPWPAARTPPSAARAVPELLSPSLAAVARAGVLGELASEAR
ncbi:MAG: ABC transporter substrate-binding protein [Planctomycetota bacterium]